MMLLIMQEQNYRGQYKMSRDADVSKVLGRYEWKMSVLGRCEWKMSRDHYRDCDC